MTLGQFLNILRARRWVVLLVLGLTVVTTVVMSLLLPKRYTATASVVVDFKPDPITAVMFGGMASPAFVATQVDIINSERVALRVVRNLKLNENPQVREQWLEDTSGEGSVEQWLIKQFQKQLDVKPSRESSVIAIGYEAPDPRFAAGLANAFMQAYIQTSLELRTDPARQYSGFFDARSKEARDAVEKAQSKLSEFQRANGIVASDERLDIENARLNELNSQLIAMQGISAESTSREVQAQGAQSDRLQEVINNPLIAQLKADVNRGEARLQELGTRYGENHPQVIESKANLAELRRRLEAETRKVTGSVGVTNTINRGREAQVRAQLEIQRAKVLQMKTVRDAGIVLMREVENAQRAYEVVMGRLQQSSLESQTTQSNVNVLTQAEPPREPSSPKMLLNTLLAILVGCLLAVGTALLLELRDPRVRSSDDVVLALDLPVLGLMPKPGSVGLMDRNAAGALQRRLLGPLPASPKRG
jgi:succinoglycan biosynthesis transport protein ExoP